MSAATLATPIGTIPNLSLVEPNSLSAREIIKGRYAVRFARNSAEIVAALKLRYEVFNLELGAGLASSFLAVPPLSTANSEPSTFQSSWMLSNQNRRWCPNL